VKNFYWIIFLSFTLISCGGLNQVVGTQSQNADQPLVVDTPMPTNTIVQTEIPLAQPTETLTHLPPTPENTPTITNTPMPSFTPTPDIRQKPNQWRSWPVAPTLSPWLEDVYLEGLAMGNNPAAFSKIGDCQNIPEAFLGIYSLPDRYYFNESSQYLQETVDHFVDSFAYDNITVDGGFNFPAIFSPIRADPEFCDPGETPLECEVRIHKPVFAIISMEFTYKGRTADNYEVYLRDTIDFLLSKKVIPILATKADNVEGGHQINLVNAQVSYEYDLPLWNFWSAVQYLPDHGIDWARDSQGFHILYEAWDARSLTALKTLDSLWRSVNDLSPTE